MNREACFCMSSINFATPPSASYPLFCEGNFGHGCPSGRAVRTALRMRLALRRLNEDWAERGWSRFEFGVGINSGEAIVGNLGCEEKREVSVIGDCVNLALHRRGEFAAAVLCMDAAERLLPGDWLSGEYLRRSWRFLAEPPGPDWTGVHVMAHR